MLTLRHPCWDGTTALRVEAEDFVARPAALVPPRGQHTVRCHGVLAPASPLRRKVVLRPRVVNDNYSCTPTTTTHASLVERTSSRDQPSLGTAWEIDPQQGHDVTRTGTYGRTTPDLAEWRFYR